MLKKIISYFGVFILICFSFFYTDRAVDIVKRNDPVMQTILANSEALKVDAVNATVNSDEIISGLNGKQVNIDKSYQNMKKVNRYLESMIVYDEIVPDIGLEYDKYVVKGNESKNQVALVFKVNDSRNLDKVNNILNEKNVAGTFFMDGIFISDNMNLIIEMVNDGSEIENFGYDGVYSSKKIDWTNNMIYSLTGKNANYCYTEYKDASILDICSKNKMYTIKPTINTSNYPFLTVKKNLESGSIISFNLNDKTVKELAINNVGTKAVIPKEHTLEEIFFDATSRKE